MTYNPEIHRTIRVDRNLSDRVIEIAKARGRSLTQEINQMMMHYIESEEAKNDISAFKLIR